MGDGNNWCNQLHEEFHVDGVNKHSVRAIEVHPVELLNLHNA